MRLYSIINKKKLIIFGIEDYLDYIAPFRNACEKQHLEIVKWLITFRDTKQHDYHDFDACCAAILPYACKKKHIEIVKLLTSDHKYFKYEIENDDIIPYVHYRDNWWQLQ